MIGTRTRGSGLWRNNSSGMNALAVLMGAVLWCPLQTPGATRSGGVAAEPGTSRQDGGGGSGSSQMSEAVLTWNTFLGGASDDYATGVAVDGAGNIYVLGVSEASWGSPVRPFTDGYPDAFVAKLDSSGTLLWNTFLGGADYEYAQGVAVDGAGNVWVAGYGWGTWGTPVNAYAAKDDVFVAKLASNGVLLWNTFLGGAGNDYAGGITVDGSGSAYITGRSEAWGAPMNPYTGGYDAFAAQLASNGSLTWSTFLGSGAYDRASDIIADGTGGLYVVGLSSGTWGSPLIPHASGTDAFVACLTGTGPVITRISSRTSTPGSAATIKGTGFSADKQKNVVSFGSKTATINKATSTKLKVTIRSRVKKGTVEVSVQADGVRSNQVSFQVK